MRRPPGRDRLRHGAAPRHARRPGRVPRHDRRPTPRPLLRPGRSSAEGRPASPAAVYGASEGLRTLALDSVAPGGQAGHELPHRELPRLPDGHLRRRPHAASAWCRPRSSARTSRARAPRPRCASRPGTSSSGSPTAPRSPHAPVIVATGARYRRLDVDGLEEFEGNGVYYAATEMRSPRVRHRTRSSSSAVATPPAKQRCSSPTPARRHLRHPRARPQRQHVPLPRRPHRGAPRIDGAGQQHVTALDGDDALQQRARDRPGRGTVRSRASACSRSSAPSPPRTGCRAARRSTSHGFVLTDRSLDAEHLDDGGSCWTGSRSPSRPAIPGCSPSATFGRARRSGPAAAVGEGSAAVRSVHDYLSFAH